MTRAVRMLAAALVLASVAAVAQAQEPGDDYTIELPAGWELASFVDGAKIKRTEYVYGDRSKGLLKIKRARAEAGETLDAAVARDVDGGLKFQPGYVQARTERFGGGALVQFDFTRGGKPMLGRNYYLQGSDGTVWVLQFTGDRATLGQIRNLTDQIARSFREK